MITYFEKRHKSLSYRILSAFITFTFIFSLVLPPGYAQLLPQTVLNLPVPGAMVPLTNGFTPTLMTGVTIHPDNPLRFDFIMDRGQSDLSGDPLKEEYRKMIKYFMASLTVPEDELWVNLSPYEKDRMVPQGLGDTEMGRDMLAQDYLLKQLTASLMYPEKELGKEFWNKVYKEAKEKFGTTEIPVNTFNKVWIVPKEALVYEQGTSAFVIKSRLAVMLEEDYEAMQHASKMEDGGWKGEDRSSILDSQSSIIKEIIIPAIEVEVNEGKNFANLRQIYNALILATWYKQRLKDSLLGKVYVDQNKTKGIDTQDKGINQKIYGQYIESFKKGVYNFIKEDVDPATREIIPRKYFSGGMAWKLGGLKTLGAFALGTLLSFGSPDVGNASALAAAATGGNNKNVVVTEFVDNAKEGDIGTAIVVKEGVQPILLAQAGLSSDEGRGMNEASSPIAVFDGTNILIRDKEAYKKMFDNLADYFKVLNERNKMGLGDEGTLWKWIDDPITAAQDELRELNKNAGELSKSFVASMEELNRLLSQIEVAEGAKRPTIGQLFVAAEDSSTASPVDREEVDSFRNDFLGKAGVLKEITEDVSDVNDEITKIRGGDLTVTPEHLVFPGWINGLRDVIIPKTRRFIASPKTATLLSPETVLRLNGFLDSAYQLLDATMQFDGDMITFAIKEKPGYVVLYNNGKVIVQLFKRGDVLGTGKVLFEKAAAEGESASKIAFAIAEDLEAKVTSKNDSQRSILSIAQDAAKRAAIIYVYDGHLPEDFIDFYASSPVAAVMEFLPDEIGRGIWGGNLFAWKFNSYLNRITGGIESDKLKIAKEMGDLIRILMGFEGRYHDFFEVLKTRDDKDRHFDADGLVEENRTRILGLLSISDTTEQALRYISIAREITKSVESQAAGERIFQVPISNMNNQVIVDVTLRITDLVSLVKEIIYNQRRPGKNFQVLVKHLAWEGRSESYYGRPGGKERRVFIFLPEIDIVWSQADQVIEEDVKDHSLQNNAGVKADIPPPVLPIIPGEEIDRVVGMVKEYDALSKTGERELRLFFAQRIQEIFYTTFLEDKKDVSEDRARHIVVSAWLAAKYHLSAVGMRGLFVYFEDGTERIFYELGMNRADNGKRLSMREAGEILAEGDLLLSNGFASASSPVEVVAGAAGDEGGKKRLMTFVEEALAEDPNYFLVEDLIRDLTNILVERKHDTPKSLDTLLSAINFIVTEYSDIVLFIPSDLEDAMDDDKVTERYDPLYLETIKQLVQKIQDSSVDDSPEALGQLTSVIEAYLEDSGTASSPVTSDEIRDTSDEFTKGGIDLNPALLDLQIKRDGNGIPLPLPMQPIKDMHIEGFLPIIINVTPITNLPLLLGLADTKQDTGETRPAMKAREPELISALN